MYLARIQFLIVVGFAVAQSFPAQAQDARTNADCPLATVMLEVSMPRLEAERRISAALGRPNKYSPHANNLTGGATKYESQNCTLIVTYAAGAPAPLVRTPSGSIEHKPPKDETVTKVELVRGPLSPLKAQVKNGA